MIEREVQTQEVRMNEGEALDASLVIVASFDINDRLSEQLNESNSPSFDTDTNSALSNEVVQDTDDVDVGPSHDTDMWAKVQYSNYDKNDKVVFDNVFSHVKQHHEQPKSVIDTYVVNQDDSNIISNKYYT